MRNVHQQVLPLMALSLTGLLACVDDRPEPGPEATAESIVRTQLAGVPAPADNPTTTAKVELGRLLFWDPVLSGDRDIACASCHDPNFAYSDGRAVSVGAGKLKTPRGALTVLDSAWNGWTALTPNPDATQAPMFWDSRMHSLEEQVLGPIVSKPEMLGGTFTKDTIFAEIVSRLNAIPEYPAKFEVAFGARAINDKTVAKAIAAFERTLVTVPSYQKWLAGDANAISESAKRGVDDFRRSGCSRCHSGPMLSDFKLHIFKAGGEAIRTPSLRNVLRTAPYMHDGRAANIDEVLNIYRRADDDGGDPLLQQLGIPDRNNRADFMAFLQSLGDGDFDKSVPPDVPSGLKVGGIRP
jgi:cytochrome c peroxidase